MSEQSTHARWLLRRTDQNAVAALVVIALAGTVGWWCWHGGRRGRMIEFERATPLSARFEVDINTASVAELMQVPGIGPALAERIIESRANAGRFAAPDDLRRVRGIGQKTMEKIRPYLRAAPADGQPPDR